MLKKKSHRSKSTGSELWHVLFSSSSELKSLSSSWFVYYLISYCLCLLLPIILLDLLNKWQYLCSSHQWASRSGISCSAGSYTAEHPQTCGTTCALCTVSRCSRKMNPSWRGTGSRWHLFLNQDQTGYSGASKCKTVQIHYLSSRQGLGRTETVNKGAGSG